MMPPKRGRSRSAPSLKRKHNTRELPQQLIIVCEGATEAAILRGVRAHLRVNSAHVLLVDECGVPKTVVATAKAEHNALRRRINARIDVFVVFDRDEHPCFSNAVAQARDLGYHLGISVPCVELYGLLLHRDQRGNIHRHVAQRELKAIPHPGYDHSRSPRLDLGTVLANQEQAAARAAELRACCAGDGEPYRNPVTWFDEVIQAIVNLAKHAA